MDMQINGHAIAVADSTVTVDDATYTLEPGEALQLDDLTITRGADGAIRVSSRSRGTDGTVVQNVSGAVSGSVMQIGNAGTINLG